MGARLSSIINKPSKGELVIIVYVKWFMEIFFFSVNEIICTLLTQDLKLVWRTVLPQAAHCFSISCVLSD